MGLTDASLAEFMALTGGLCCRVPPLDPVCQAFEAVARWKGTPGARRSAMPCHYCASRR
jgi:hypothetical protein